MPPKKRLTLGELSSILRDESAPEPNASSSRADGRGGTGSSSNGSGSGSGSGSRKNKGKAPADSLFRQIQAEQERERICGPKHAGDERTLAVHPAALAAAQKAAAQKAAKGGDAAAAEDDDDDPTRVCHICTERIHFVCMGPCQHPICHRCFIRLRALHDDRECKMCKQTLETAIAGTREELGLARKPAAAAAGAADGDASDEDDQTDAVAALFAPAAYAALPFHDAKLAMGFTGRAAYDAVTGLLAVACPMRKCTFEVPAGAPWEVLREHCKTVHHKVFCELCHQHKKVFLHERQLFSEKELRLHMAKGDLASKQTNFKGHPKCGFCGTRFYDDDALFTHCRQKHELCFICENAGVLYRYYENAQGLANHFEEEHYVCRHAPCADGGLIAFASAEALGVHLRDTHGQTGRRNRLITNLTAAYTQSATLPPGPVPGASAGTGAGAGASANGAGRRNRSSNTASAAEPRGPRHAESRASPAPSAGSANGANGRLPDTAAAPASGRGRAPAGFGSRLTETAPTPADAAAAAATAAASPRGQRGANAAAAAAANSRATANEASRGARSARPSRASSPPAPAAPASPTAPAPPLSQANELQLLIGDPTRAVAVRDAFRAYAQGRLDAAALAERYMTAVFPGLPRYPRDSARVQRAARLWETLARTLPDAAPAGPTPAAAAVQLALGGPATAPRGRGGGVHAAARPAWRAPAADPTDLRHGPSRAALRAALRAWQDADTGAARLAIAGASAPPASPAAGSAVGGRAGYTASVMSNVRAPLLRTTDRRAPGAWGGAATPPAAGAAGAAGAGRSTPSREEAFPELPAVAPRGSPASPRGATSGGASARTPQATASWSDITLRAPQPSAPTRTRKGKVVLLHYG